MITKIDIGHFGLFKDYSWDTVISKDNTFKKMNIIYGRNYSGKTTLARIFKCFEDSLMHKDYLACQFKVTLNNGNIIAEKNLQDFAKHNQIRVYNTDFVRENLGWLYREDGTIRPFTILGAKNVELDKQITLINYQLGTIEAGKGLVFEYDKAQKALAAQKKTNSDKTDILDDKLRKRANDTIKVNNDLFLPTNAKKSYTITDIKADIDQIKSDVKKHILATATADELIKLLKEVAIDDVNPLTESQPKFADYYKECNDILQKKITPSTPIAELINDNLLQEWVRLGIDKHRDKRKTCGFCGNPLDKDLWKRLDEHFSKESEELRAALKGKIDQLELAKKGLTEFMTLKREQFYSTLQTRFDGTLKSWHTVSNAYQKKIDQLITELKIREKDIFRLRELPADISDLSDEVLATIKDFNQIITEHNKKTSSLATDQVRARKELRFSNIAQYISDIDYFNELKAIEQQDNKLNIVGGGLILQKQEIERLVEDKRVLETQAKDESKGAELINQHLTHFFGHNELKLTAQGESPNMKFIIQREGIDANNLSEGECSLISFCYFIAKIEDELKDELNSNKLIIYIDDPISSLDSNHIFFMFSLIESVIAGPKKYGQLFISTHNLDFLRYLKKLTFPKKDLKHFIIERRNKSNTLLRLAPEYLKNYITEFNYLFDQIYQCSLGDREIISHNYQYSFGNNMRKFLEAYLFYKYPSHKMTSEEKLRKYFDNDRVTINLINRVINEYSHIGEHFERGMEPIDMDEITKVSSLVLNRISTTDPDQYNALMDSVNQLV
ncbi:AAA family ATPase [Mucilaginibacter terrae]|uniref:Wobble nucleotide-excising tRNase n=1 Tax=Mucilaginibacter terrae TaxID=1955052 RepID=A0ABU3GR53_9SPHI|nr:AAA family ATPase [Mucilaginibacter terrae]MDT3402264.1 wobble nucleotide-excising tRNase [Mucilaginibacter terrae]